MAAAAAEENVAASVAEVSRLLLATSAGDNDDHEAGLSTARPSSATDPSLTGGCAPAKSRKRVANRAATRFMKRKKGPAGCEPQKLPGDPELYQDSITDSLLSWLVAQGAQLDGVRIENTNGRAGRRLVAVRELPAGFVFLRLPAQCALSPSACAASSLGRRIQAKHRLVTPGGSDEEVEADSAQVEEGADECVTHRSVLYAFLMLAPEEDPTFGPFIAHLKRKAPSTPHLWSQSDRERLPSDVFEDFHRFFSHILGQHKLLFPALSDSFPEEFPPAACSLDAWLWAHAVFSSNAFKSEGGDPANADGVLLPLLDCLNHDSEAANVEWLGLGLDDDRGARVTRPILEGEELLYSYGCKGNSVLVPTYGFAVWDNPHEEFTLELNLACRLTPEAACWSPAVERLERVASASDAELRGTGAVAFCLRPTDFYEEALPRGLLEAATVIANAPSTADQDPFVLAPSAAELAAGRALLRELLLEAGAQLMRRTKGGPALGGRPWARLDRAMRRQDALRLGSHQCAATPEGCAMALRSARLQVITAALDALEEAEAEAEAETEAESQAGATVVEKMDVEKAELASSA